MANRMRLVLLLSAYKCMSKKPDLVILDYPISSFEGSKTQTQCSKENNGL